MIVRNASGGPLARPGSGDVSWPPLDTGGTPALDAQYELIDGAVVDLLADGFNTLTDLENDPEFAALVASGDLVRVVGGEDVDAGVPVRRGKGGADYNHSGPAINVPANTWTDLPNNGLGSFTNLGGLAPLGASALLDTSTGQLDFSELQRYDDIVVRQDIEVSSAVNGAVVRLRVLLGEPGVAQYPLEHTVAVINQGGGFPTPLVEYIELYLGDANTQNHPGIIQVYCTEDATVTNNGSYIKVFV